MWGAAATIGERCTADFTLQRERGGDHVADEQLIHRERGEGGPEIRPLVVFQAISRLVNYCVQACKNMTRQLFVKNLRMKIN